MQPRRGLSWLGWLAADIVGVLVFCAVGRRSHAEGVTIGGVASTAWPFLTGTILGWLVARGWRRPTSVAPTGVIVWVSTVTVGMVLRKASSAGVATSFVIVAGGRRAQAATPPGRLTKPSLMVRTGEERGTATGAEITAIFGATARAVRPPMDLVATRTRLLV